MAAVFAGSGEGAPRLAEVLTAVSLLSDQGMGEEQGEALRSCLLAVRLARTLGVDGQQLADVYYASLLHHIGCTATAADEAARFRVDETLLRPLISVTDFTRPAQLLALLRTAGSSVPPAQRAALTARLATSGHWGAAVQQATCEVAAALARRLGLGAGVCTALAEQFERWDGKGAPGGLRGEEITLVGRISLLAAQAIRLAGVVGPQGAVEAVGERAGWLGPDLVTLLSREGPGLLTADPYGDPYGDSHDDLYEEALAAEPQPWLRLVGTDLDRVVLALGDFADLKSPCLYGHSRGVATLARQAAHHLGAAEQETALLRRAALVHDLGRVAVPSRIWGRTGQLTTLDWEAVRLHAYHGERVLSRSAALRDLAPLVGRHHERLDGSGYHRQASGADLPMTARVLAAADVYHAMTEPRPYRTARSTAEAAGLLEDEARAGRLDAQAVGAVLAAAGVARRRSAPWPAGLSDREAEVLRLLARGSSNREIAARLSISPRTAEHHVEHIYAKIGTCTRPAAALFAMEHGLLSTE